MVKEFPGGLSGEIYRMGKLVQGQLEDAIRAISLPDPVLGERVVERDDLVDHFYMATEEKIFQQMGSRRWSAAEWRWLRSAMRVVINLEHVGDSAAKVAAQASRLGGFKPGEPDLLRLAQTASRCLDRSLEAFLEKNLALAEEVFSLEEEADKLLEETITLLGGGLQEHPEKGRRFLILMFVAENLEKITDYALNVAEWVIYWVLGQRIKFANYAELKKLLSGVFPKDFRRYWNGISGATVGGIELPCGTKLLYKSGSPRKVGQEVEKARQWAQYKEGVIPQVLAVLEGKERQAFLRELGKGQLLQDYYEQVGLEEKLRVTRELFNVLTEIWASSRCPTRPQSAFTRQIEERLEEVFRLHPTLAEVAAKPLIWEGYTLPPLAFCIEAVKEREPELAPGFSVWIHGDFNSNNVLYSRESGFQFIDVARSGLGDYLQDVSVFVVSNERRPVGKRQASELAEVNRLFMELVRGWARENQDMNFEVRLKLGLARSLITSARLWPDLTWAQGLFRRGWALLNEVRETLGST
jgi:phosphate uptake regulator/aminoglycoside phosphotransferase